MIHPSSTWVSRIFGDVNWVALFQWLWSIVLCVEALLMIFNVMAVSLKDLEVTGFITLAMILQNTIRGRGGDAR